MVGSSFDSNDVSVKTVKFLCSYGGKILPRRTDGKLRYVGGETRVLAVDRSVSFSELLLKLGELCGSSVSLRCQLPTEDLDALVSITSDEDLSILIEEYDRVSRVKSISLKIRAFLSPPKSLKKISPPSSAVGCMTPSGMAANGSVGQISKPVRFPISFEKSSGSKLPYYTYLPQINPRYVYVASNGKHWFDDKSWEDRICMARPCA